ncbi:hypothetical protein AcW1_007596 [Taiwanofungus camphoratus]|nr:hypothetical protein AcW1_007596 [Antrodia cinnamomea]KAI0953357.1 hypothetical protein AcW1_007596 [Antrodia cinnamomea]
MNGSDRTEGHWKAVQVELLRYADIPRAVTTAMQANRADPIIRYIVDAADPGRSLFYELKNRMVWALDLAETISRRRAFTIDRGDAIIISNDPKTESRPPAGLGRIAGIAKNLILACLRWATTKLDSNEQRRRRLEWLNKRETAIKEAIGNEADDMLYLGSLATAPSKQGRGYGARLVGSLTAEADAQGRSVWLCSSNSNNTSFYERCGFSTTNEFVLGGNNPTWKQPPVTVRIMTRKPLSERLSEDRLY